MGDHDMSPPPGPHPYKTAAALVKQLYPAAPAVVARAVDLGLDPTKRLARLLPS